MTQHDLLDRLSQLESEVTLIRAALLAQPEPKPTSLLTKPEPGSEEGYWFISGDWSGAVLLESAQANEDDPKYYEGGNMFQTDKLADAYAEAIETMLLLRHQPGTEPALAKKVQLVISPRFGPDRLQICEWSSMDIKAEYLSPCFQTQDAAQAAIDTIGADRILRMFKTLHHVGG